jgi:transposase
MEGIMEINPIYRSAVGMDVHLAQVTVCAIVAGTDGEVKVETREFGAFKRDRRAMAEWIAAWQPEVVVMESTGIYWKSPYAALEKVGIRTLVVNAHHVKKVPGRKTDVSDAQWLAMLARSGLLRGSFIPPEHLRHLRLLARQHNALTGQLAAEKNRLVKVLGDGGIRLSALVSDMHGQSARRMIDALLAGEAPAEVVRYADRRLKAPHEELMLALDGELSPQHRFLGEQLRAHIDFLEQMLAHFEAMLLAEMASYEAAMSLLKTLPGVDDLSAAKVLVEIGTDMEAFGSAERLASWAGLCPGNHKSDGKQKSGKTPKGNRYLRRVLCEIAHAASRTTSYFKTKYQGLAIRRGTKRAIMAVAHKVLKTAFIVLQRQEVYRDSTVDYEALLIKRRAPRWIQQLKKHGLLPVAS